MNVMFDIAQDDILDRHQSGAAQDPVSWQSCVISEFTEDFTLKRLCRKSQHVLYKL